MIKYVWKIRKSVALFCALTLPAAVALSAQPELPQVPGNQIPGNTGRTPTPLPSAEEPGTDTSPSQAVPEKVTSAYAFGAAGDGDLRVLRTIPVPEGTPGLEEGDRIVSVDGMRFTTDVSLQEYLAGQSGQVVQFVVERGTRQITLRISAPVAAAAATSAAWLGVVMSEEGRQPVPGAGIAQVFPSGPAARAGMWPGDVVVEADQVPIASTQELIALIEKRRPADRVKLAVVRNSIQVPMTVVLGRKEDFLHRSRTQPRGQKDGQSEVTETDFRSEIPLYAMELEHNRHMAEQHQRMERLLLELKEDIKQLRQELAARTTAIPGAQPAR